MIDANVLKESGSSLAKFFMSLTPNPAAIPARKAPKKPAPPEYAK